MKPWRATQYGTDKLITLAGALAYFAIPFHFNVAFRLGVAGQVSTGSGSSVGLAGQNAATVDFADTITWGGKGLVLDPNGQNASGNFQVQSLTSNFNYNLPTVPGPASWTLMIVGFGLAGAALRRFSRRSSIRYCAQP